MKIGIVVSLLFLLIWIPVNSFYIRPPKTVSIALFPGSKHGVNRQYVALPGNDLPKVESFLSNLPFSSKDNEATLSLFGGSNTINPSSSLNPVQRLSRALSFYSSAIPIFFAYKRLATEIRLREEYLKQQYTEEEKSRLFNQLHDWGSDEIVKKINELKGFYVKTGQIISTRVDIFPPQYTSKLSITQDQLDPLPANVVKDVIERELLQGAKMSELFAEFDDIPLGSASIAQVHRAKLLDGRVVAVKVQRPAIEGKLLGDIQNLKNFAKVIGDSLLIDYYKIFTEIEKTLIYELDFLFEAQATVKVASAVAHSPSNKPQKPPVVVPLPIPGLVSKRVMVLEYVEGKALSKIGAELEKRGIKAGSPESLVLGSRLLTALTDAYGSMIFGSGIIHGDPHPGNIFVLEGGQVALLDCGQVKQINTSQRLGLAKLVVLVNQWETINRRLGNIKSTSSSKTEENKKVSSKQLEADEKDLQRLTSDIANMVRSFGVSFKEGAGDEAAAATAILLFGNSDTILPGGYAGEEVSLDSPIVQVAEFPSELVLLGRATVMIKGIANRLGVVWGLSDRWAKMAQEAIASEKSPVNLMPVWSVSPPLISSPNPDESNMIRSLMLPAPSTSSSSSTSSQTQTNGLNSNRIRFKDVLRGLSNWLILLREYLKNKLISVLLPILPRKMKSMLFKFIAKAEGIKTVTKPTNQ